MFSGQFEWFAIGGGIIPARFSDAVLVPDGVTLAPAWLTPLTATLIHDGGFHLGFNLLMLIYTGRIVERAFGSGLTLLLYIVGAYAAALVQWAVDPLSPIPTIGASGAVSALVGAYALLFPSDRVRAIGPIPAGIVRIAWLLAAWSVINVLIGLISAQAGMPIAAAAHIGGFAAGLLLFRPLLSWRWRRA